MPDGWRIIRFDDEISPVEQIQALPAGSETTSTAVSDTSITSGGTDRAGAFGAVRAPPRQEIVYSPNARNTPPTPGHSTTTQPDLTSLLGATVFISARSPLSTSALLPILRVSELEPTIPGTSRPEPMRSAQMPTPPDWAGLPSLEQSQALLASLQTLRSTLAARVDTLSTEVDRLRRRAEELEQGIEGQRENQVAQDTSMPGQRRPQGGRSDAALEMDISADGTDVADSKGAVEGKIIGSGRCDTEEGILERRARRSASMKAKIDPAAQLGTTGPDASSSSTLTADVHPISRRHAWIPSIPAPMPFERGDRADRNIPAGERLSNRIAERRRSIVAAASNASPSPTSSTVNLLDEHRFDLDRFRGVLDQRAGRRTENDQAMEIEVVPGGTSHTGESLDESLTTRGQRVGRDQHVPSRAARSAQRQVGLAVSYTRYRDALLSDLPPSDMPDATTNPAADAIPSYPGLSRGILGSAPMAAVDLLDIDAGAAASLARSGRAGESARPTASVPFPRRSQMVQDLRAAARTQEELNQLSSMVASLRERLRSVMGATVERTARTTAGSSGFALREEFFGRRPSTSAQADRETSPRRPAYPFAHTSSHPHHRPRIGPDPIAAVMNLDNHNSFDLNFDGNIVFRPIAVREPDRELIARCLSMLPGGRADTPSRWMRLTGGNGNRARRATTTAGFWVRWITDEDVANPPPSHRHVDMSNLPTIRAYDFCVSPPDDEAFVRADEVEFHNPRTTLLRHVGPWMHSRVRIAPFESDPPIARWGTSSHVRQAVQSRGGLGHGDVMTFDLRARSVEVTRAAGSRRPATSRGLVNASSGVTRGIPAVDIPNLRTVEESSRIALSDLADPDAWLLAYEPAIGQIRAHWRAHYRRQYSGESHPIERRPRAAARSIIGADEPTESWSRDYLDADGMPLPAIPLATNGTVRATGLSTPSREGAAAAMLPLDPDAITPADSEDSSMDADAVVLDPEGGMALSSSIDYR